MRDFPVYLKDNESNYMILSVQTLHCIKGQHSSLIGYPRSTWILLKCELDVGNCSLKQIILTINVLKMGTGNHETNLNIFKCLTHFMKCH